MSDRAAVQKIENLFQLKRACYSELQKLVEKGKNVLDEIQRSGEKGENFKKLMETLESVKDEINTTFLVEDDDYFFAVASLAALRSKDPRTPVGACIVDNYSKIIVGIGYNSMPYTPFCNNDKEPFSWKRNSAGSEKDKGGDTKYSYVCHAAVNAIVNRTIPDLTDCVMYVTQCPDEDCAHLIAQSGIKEVRYQRNMKRGNKDHEENAKRILQLARVSFRERCPRTEVSLKIERMCMPMQSDTLYIANEVKILDLERKVKQLKQELYRSLLTGERVLITTNIANKESLREQGLDTQEDEMQVEESLREASHHTTQDDKIQKDTSSKPGLEEELKFKNHQTKQIIPQTWVIQRQCPSYLSQTLLKSPSDVDSLPHCVALSLRKRIDWFSSDDAEECSPFLVITWEELFMGLAQLEHIYSNATDSKPQYKVGACIVNPSKQVIAIGGSSGAKELESLGEGRLFTTASSISKNPYDEHAEYKTIASYKGTASLRGCTLYVTLSPCKVCARLIAQTGIVEVVYLKKLKDDHEFDLSKTIFENCNIICRAMNDEKFEMEIEKAPDPQPFPLTWMNSFPIECTRENNLIYQATIECEEYWICTLGKLCEKHPSQPKPDEVKLGSVNIYSKKTVDKGHIKIFNRNTGQYDDIGSLKIDGGHFYKQYTNNFKVTKDQPLIKVKDLSPDDTEATINYLTIYFEMIV